MAGKFPLDLSKFKRISSDEKTTTLHHPAGHKITVAHSALTPKMRGQLAAMPMAEGGAVQKMDKTLSDNWSSQIDPKIQAEEDAKIAQASPPPQKKAHGGEIKQSNPKLEESKKVPMYAEGTPDQPVQTQDQQPQPQQPTVVINNGTPPAATDANAQPQATPEPLAHHIGAAVRQGVADTLGAVKGAADKVYGPLYNMGQQLGQGLAGDPQQSPQAAAPAPATAAQAPAASPQSAPTTPQQPQDPFGTGATLQSFQQGLGETKAGIAGEAAATGAEGQEQASDLGQMVQRQQENLQNYKQHYDYLDNERQAFQQDVMNQHIDPKHYLNNMGTSGKISTGIGLILGGMGGGLLHQGNPVMDFLNRQIDRDIEGQKANLGKSESLLNANMRQFGNLRDATDMTKIMQSDIVSNQLKQAAAKAMTPLAKARALQAAGQIDMNTAQLQGQMAMRKTLLSGMNSGQVDPAKVVNLLIPENQRAAANKELTEAQSLSKAKNDALAAFDQISKINTVANRGLHPIDSKKQIKALRDPIIAKLSKETAGRFTEQDADMLGSLYDTIGTSKETNALQRRQLSKQFDEKMNFPILNTYGIMPSSWSRYDSQGSSKIQNLPPNIK